MDQIGFGQALGVLGSYVAVLLVLAVAVETVLESLTLVKRMKKPISPDVFMKDIKNWLPTDAPAGAQAAAIFAFADEYKTSVGTVEELASALKTITSGAAAAVGAADELAAAQKKVATHLAEVRKSFDSDERRRIAIHRLVAGLVGIGIAILVRIDTFALLKDLVPQTFHISPWVGMVVSGVAASAGSSFWHDVLGHVRALKEQTESNATSSTTTAGG
ncbi:MAG: hypothetical protein R3D98_00625 [Candidatus Krumholzibacteriia bacterium]